MQKNLYGEGVCNGCLCDNVRGNRWSARRTEQRPEGLLFVPLEPWPSTLCELKAASLCLRGAVLAESTGMGVLSRPSSSLDASDSSLNPSSETTVPESRAFFQTCLRQIWLRGEASWC